VSYCLNKWSTSSVKVHIVSNGVMQKATWEVLSLKNLLAFQGLVAEIAFVQVMQDAISNN